MNNTTISNLSATINATTVGLREVSLSFSLLFASLLGIVTCIGCVANGLVVVAVIGDAKMRKSPMNLLLLNLALADLLYLVAFTPFWASMTLHGDGGWHFPECFCPIGRYISNSLLVISILTYVAICVERFVAIVHPMHAAVWCTWSRVLLVILGIWTFAMAYQFPYLALFQTQPAPWNANLRICRSRLAGKSALWRAYKWSEFAITYVLPVLLSTAFYSRICRVLWAKDTILRKTDVKKRSTASSESSPPNGNGQNHNASARTIRRVLETKFVSGISQVAPERSAKQQKNASTDANLHARRSVVKMLILCVALFFLSYTPMVVYFLWGALFGRPLPLPFAFVFLTSTLVQLQSAFNPFLYTLFATQFRQKCAKLAMALLGPKRNGNDGNRRNGNTGGDGNKASAKSTTSSIGS